MTPEEQETMVQELETALDRLQALYNQYFMGIERLEPTVQRKDVERKMQALRREKISNTALRFRFQTQVQKFNTQSNYWKRISRQIEEGTYTRDVNRAQKRSDGLGEMEMAARALSSLDGAPLPREPEPATTAALEIDDPFADASPAKTRPGKKPAARDPDKTPVPAVGSDLHSVNERLVDAARGGDEDEDLSSFFSKRPSVAPPAPAVPQRASLPPPAPAQAAPAPRPQLPRPKLAAPAAAPSQTVSEERMKAIYRAYIAARQKTNESTDNVSFAKISALLKKQVAEKPGVNDFKVVIRDGKAIIKTVKD
jgi:hypothetical protein